MTTINTGTGNVNQLGSGNNIPNQVVTQASQSPVSNFRALALLQSGTLTVTTGQIVAVTATTTAEQTWTVTGLLTTDEVFKISLASGAANTTGLGIVNSRVSAADTLAVTFMNVSTGTLTPVTGVYNVTVARPLPNIVSQLSAGNPGFPI